MKLSIGENIRNFRKKNGLTQEAFADRLGVSYQSVSRWENGSTYPDLELIPSISEALGVTVDELFGIPGIEKEKRAVQAFDELRRECMKRDYDADRIVELIRDIRRNYMDSNDASRPWCEGNDRAFRDPVILPEVRLMAEAYLARHPAYCPAIATVANIEDDEHLQEFLNKYTTPCDCSAPALLFDRYFRRGDAERFDPERRYMLFQAFDTILCPRCLLKLKDREENKAAAGEFMDTMLSVIRCDAVDDAPDMWTRHRIELGIETAKRYVYAGNTTEAIRKLESVVKLLEETMKITDTAVLPTSCHFLDGMKWSAWEDWDTPDNSPDSPEERCIFIEFADKNKSAFIGIHPSYYYQSLLESAFDCIRDNPTFEKICKRVKALIVTK